MSLRAIMLGTLAFVGVGTIGSSPVTAQPAKKPMPVDRLVRVTYPVADIVVPMENRSAFAESKPRRDAPDKSRDEIAAAVIQLITSTVSRDSWEPNGGRASIQYFPFGLSLVVHQTEDAHAEIASLLAALRRRYEVQVSVQVDIVEVPPATADRLRAVMKKHGQPIQDRAVEVEDSCLKSLLELAQADQKGTLRQAPKSTLFSGQKGAFSSLVQKVGVRFDVSGIVSADRISIRLWLDVESSPSSMSTIRSAQTFNVPGNRTVVWQMGEVGGVHIFVMARPRILIAEEEEKIYLGKIPPPPGR